MIKALVTFFVMINAKKKRPSPTSNLDKNDRFLAIERELYCIGCKALVNVLQQELRGSLSETDVITAMSSICQPKHMRKGPYRQYNFDR